MIGEARIVEFVKELDSGTVICLVQWYDYAIKKKGKQWSFPVRSSMPKYVHRDWGFMNKRSVYFNILSGDMNYPKIKIRKLVDKSPSEKFKEVPDVTKF